MNFSLQGNLVDIINQDIFPAKITIIDGMITDICKLNYRCKTFILPPFVDAHLHFESSMLLPAEFARTAAIHGTVGIVADPHEIANVLGKEGVRYLVKNAQQVPLKIYFGAPSCVPATAFETSGYTITSADVQELFEKDRLHLLGEMMNFPGVIHNDAEALAKINIAKQYGKVIDGHCPLLKGDDLRQYIDAGITTDHEATTLEEAIEKIQMGMSILIRNGSAANDFESLYPVIDMYPDKVMFCSDDLEASSLLKGHINLVVRSAIKKGCNLMNVLCAASLNPIKHYKLDIGLLQIGNRADFIVVDNLTNFSIIKTYCDGDLIAAEGNSYINSVTPKIINNFNAVALTPDKLIVRPPANFVGDTVEVNVIGTTTNKLLTKRENHVLRVVDNATQPDTKNDILKLVVLNRYENKPPAIGFVRGLQLNNIAIASSVAHDSHNIIATGSDDEKICAAINAVILNKGGICIAYDSEVKILTLPIAGLISDLSIDKVAKLHHEINQLIAEKGNTLGAPLMTLSFLALLVIPEIKLSDKGLFDSVQFKFIDN